MVLLCQVGSGNKRLASSTELITELGNLATIKLDLSGDVLRMDADN